MEIPIISEDLFKQNSPVTGDTVITEFVPYIVLVQQIYMEPILGLALMTELQDQIKAASVTPPPSVNPITEANQALLLKIAPALSFYAVYQGLPFHWASVVNKGLTIRESENSKGVQINDVAQLRRWIKDDAEAFANRLNSYLCECAAKYPLWAPGKGWGCPNTNCGCEDNTKDYDFGIYIP